MNKVQWKETPLKTCEVKKMAIIDKSGSASKSFVSDDDDRLSVLNDATDIKKFIIVHPKPKTNLAINPQRFDLAEMQLMFSPDQKTANINETDVHDNSLISINENRSLITAKNDEFNTYHKNNTNNNNNNNNNNNLNYNNSINNDNINTNNNYLYDYNTYNSNNNNFNGSAFHFDEIFFNSFEFKQHVQLLLQIEKKIKVLNISNKTGFFCGNKDDNKNNDDNKCTSELEIVDYLKKNENNGSSLVYLSEMQKKIFLKVFLFSFFIISF
jgi:hypothetical protein